MKKFISLILSLILTVALLASCTMEDMEYIGERVQEHIDEQTPTDPEPDPEPEPSTYEKIAAVAAPLDEHYTLERLNQKEIFSDFSHENLKEIMAGFDVIIDNNSVIQMKRTNFLQDLFASKDVEYSYSVDTIFVDTDIERRVLKYAMFASVYMENFSDNTFPIVSEEARALYNSEPNHSFMICFGSGLNIYKDRGGYIGVRDGRLTYGVPMEKTYSFSASNIQVYDEKAEESRSSGPRNLLYNIIAS